MSRFAHYSDGFRNGLEKLRDNKAIYPHQYDAVVAITNFFGVAKDKPALVVLPTGTGKTGIGILASYVLASTNVLVLTPSEEISRQVFKEFCGGESSGESFLAKYGIIGPHEEREVLPVGACVTKTRDLQSSSVRRHELLVVNAHKFGDVDGKKGVPMDSFKTDDFDVIIVDEAHHYPAVTWSRVVDYFKQSKVFVGRCST